MTPPVGHEQWNLEGKTVLVTGATGQLGTALCQAYIDAGALVIGTDKELNKKHMLTNKRIEYREMDVTHQEQIGNVMAEVADLHGPIHILVNNAGVSCFEPFEERPESSLDWVMDVNIKGTFFCIQQYVNLFDAQKFKSGAIVNIASIYGIISPDFRIYTDCPRKNSEIYGATKAGIIQMTRYFGVHLAERGIRINAISPGGIFNPESPQGEDFIKNYAERCPMKRMAKAHEITGVALFLSCNCASYITGHNLVVDGGMSCW